MTVHANTATYEHALRGLREVNASVWSREIVEFLARHGREEGALLQRYQPYADDADPAVRYLVQLIIEDEHRHHRIGAELANAIAWEGFDRDEVDAVPVLPLFRAEDDSLQAQTRVLRESEERDRLELELLRKQLGDVADTTMWRLLIDLMMLDTEKHVRILRFIEHHVR